MGSKFRFEVIKDYMVFKKLSIKQFCKMCEISHYEFNQLRKGDNSFRFSVLCKVAKAMHYDLFNFFCPDLDIDRVYKL